MAKGRDISIEILSELTAYSKYARYKEEIGRRETWEENVARVENMHINKFPDLKEDINKAFDFVRRKEVVPSMRSMQFGGQAIENMNMRIYNCSFIAIERPAIFSEMMALLMAGTGVGYSVQSRHINKLPEIKIPKRSKKYVIDDTIVGWADALKALLKAYFYGNTLPIFDYSQIRPKGSPLKTSGGKAPGPEPLRKCLDEIQSIFMRKLPGEKLKSIEVHDIVCHIADCILAGGIRRSATIALFDAFDDDMMNCKGYLPAQMESDFTFNKQGKHFEGDAKHGDKIVRVYLTKQEFDRFETEGVLPWYWFHPQRARANNSATFFRNRWLGKETTEDKLISKLSKEFGINEHSSEALVNSFSVFLAEYLGARKVGDKYYEEIIEPTTQEEFMKVWKACEASGAGEPGVFWTNHPDYGTNPCITGDTLVYTADGRGNVTIKELAEDGKDVPVFCYDDSGKVVIRTMRNPRLTGNNADIYELVLENGHKIKATKNHKFLMKSGEYKELGQIQPGESIQILTRENLLSGKVDIKSGFDLIDESDHIIDFHYNSNGITNEEIKSKILTATKILGRMLLSKDFEQMDILKSLPKYSSGWRLTHLGNSYKGLRKWAAIELGFEVCDNVDPITTNRYLSLLEDGYDVELVDGDVIFNKVCEISGKKFKTTRKEVSVLAEYAPKKTVNDYHNMTTDLYDKQLSIYTKLRFELGREPMKKEWVDACKDSNISTEICRDSSPFRYWNDLKEAAVSYNHRVVSVNKIGVENVYNGTVDDYHNFFVTDGMTITNEDGSTKMLYVNNLQCGEISLKSSEFCNLSSINVSTIRDQKDLENRVWAATLIGTLQSSYDNFEYISETWQANLEEERLLGVSLTGICDLDYEKYDWKKAAQKSVEVNAHYAEKLGINVAARITCIKPEGTASLVMGTASGIHARHAKYYIRRVRYNKQEPIAKYLMTHHPELVEEEEGNSLNIVVAIPQKSPEHSISRENETAIDTLERVKFFNNEWVTPGHRSGPNQHNVSCTISVRPGEWAKVAKWMWDNRNVYSGIAVLPYSDANYKQAPFEECTEETYLTMMKNLKSIDLTKVIEAEDNTNLVGELACSSGSCEIF